MSYIRKKGAGLMGFGDASSCGAGQVWYPNLTFNGITGQCSTPAAAQAALASGAATGNLDTTAASSGGSIWDSIVGGISNVLKAKVTPAPVTNITTTSSGISPTTIALAGAGILGIVLLMRSRK